MTSEPLLQMTSTIVSSYAARNRMDASELPSLIRSVHAALSGLACPAVGGLHDDTEDGAYRDGIRTIYDDRLVCLEDRREVVFLTRHLHRLGLTPDSYRAKWSLPRTYPMVAPSYAERKRSLAIAAGLGRCGGIRPRHDAMVASSVDVVPPSPQRRRRAGTLSPA